MATARESAQYTSQYTNKYMADSRLHRGNIVPLPFTLTTVSVSATGDTYKLTEIPANARVIDLFCNTGGVAASAGVGATVKIGDATDDDRYMAATDFDVVNASGVLASAGNGYTPTANTVVLATITGTHLAGKTVTGVIYVIPGS